jgi:hypothetical protein
MALPVVKNGRLILNGAVRHPISTIRRKCFQSPFSQACLRNVKGLFQSDQFPNVTKMRLYQLARMQCIALFFFTGTSHAFSLKEMIHQGDGTNVTPPVSAEISRSLLNPGETAEFKLRIIGVGDVTVPEVITVPGLDIRLRGKSAENDKLWFKTSRSVTCTYIVTPLKHGSFSIPAIPVNILGKSFSSSPVSVAVPSCFGGDAKKMRPPEAPPSPMTALSQSDSRPKMALLIADADYAHFGSLPNPISDARLLRASLEKIGFKVDLLENATREAMLDGLENFKERLESTHGIAFFHFGGHGVQVNGKNYLIPVEADIPDERRVATRSVDLDDALATINESEASVNIVVIDACRDNPLKFASSRGISRGLTVVQATPRNSVIIFAAEAGSKAEDGLFTPTLAEMIDIPGRSLSQTIKDVRRRVYDLSNGEQTPGAYDQLFEEVYLAGSPDAGDPLGAAFPTPIPKAPQVYPPLAPHPTPEGKVSSMPDPEGQSLLGKIVNTVFVPPALPDLGLKTSTADPVPSPNP